MALSDMLSGTIKTINSHLNYPGYRKYMDELHEAKKRMEKIQIELDAAPSLDKKHAQQHVDRQWEWFFDEEEKLGYNGPRIRLTTTIQTDEGPIEFR